jgi:hypothetical protein
VRRDFGIGQVSSQPAQQAHAAPSAKSRPAPERIRRRKNQPFP